MEELDLTEAERVVAGWSRETKQRLIAYRRCDCIGEMALGDIISTYANGKLEVKAIAGEPHFDYKLTVGAVSTD